MGGRQAGRQLLVSRTVGLRSAAAFAAERAGASAPPCFVSNRAGVVGATYADVREDLAGTGPGGQRKPITPAQTAADLGVTPGLRIRDRRRADAHRSQLQRRRARPHVDQDAGEVEAL